MTGKAKTFEFSFGRDIPMDALLRLMPQVGAGERTVEGLEKMLSTTSAVLGVWDGDKLIAFARVITDWIYRAVIEDVVVDEPYRGMGVGSGMMRALASKLSDVEHVYLFTNGERHERFYNRFGFERPSYFSMRLLPNKQQQR